MSGLLALCAILATALAITVAYDFEDADFNQFLADDLEDGLDTLDSAFVHYRVRRAEDANPPAQSGDDKCKKRRRKPSLCCADDIIDQQHEKDRETFRSCFREVLGVEKSGHHRRGDPFSCKEAEKRRNDMTCVTTCYGQKKGFLDDQGNPIPEALTKSLKDAFAKESWFDGVADKIVTTCLKEADNATQYQPKPSSDDIKLCNPSGLTLKHCLFKQIQLSCPADQIKDQKACDKFQDRIKKGLDDVEPQPPPPFDGPRDD
uniref:Pheromone binding protein 18 n=1 Tax=Cyrtotrachelus buqueti TaxID=1892066 RepID=A0A1L3KPT2_9CUCU|nr:pheromone binding protein 18 [Cyrtotrachelus buqueti]